MIIIKKYFRYIGIIGICLLSFYYTEKVALFVRNKNPLMQSINEIKDSKYVNSIDCIIVDDLYIIPGLNGKEVNSDASFANMHEDKLYTEDKLVFNEIKPTISLEDNKDKIIIKGNSKKNSVSLIFESISDKTKYMLQNNYKVNVLINEVINSLDYELINNANTEKNYNSIENFLNNFKINKELCYVKNEVSPSCQNKYLFKTSIEVNHSNLSSIKNTIKSGDIILIKDSLSLSEFTILLNQIKYQDLNIVPLSKLIDESTI